MKKFALFTFWSSAVLIVLSIVLLVTFKLFKFTNMHAAYIVGSSAMLGGIGLVVSTLILFIKNDIANIWGEKLSFHLPEIIIVGLVAIAFGVILFFGKVIR